MKTVLVVDDAVIDQRLAGGYVEAAGCVPAYANNGVEALEAIKTAPPDVVLTDLQMPEMDGLELVRRVCQEHPSIPVILMTLSPIYCENSASKPSCVALFSVNLLIILCSSLTVRLATLSSLMFSIMIFTNLGSP